MTKQPAFFRQFDSLPFVFFFPIFFFRNTKFLDCCETSVKTLFSAMNDVIKKTYRLGSLWTPCKYSVIWKPRARGKTFIVLGPLCPHCLWKCDVEVRHDLLLPVKLWMIGRVNLLKASVDWHCQSEIDFPSIRSRLLVQSPEYVHVV